MLIGGLQKTTLIDFPGLVACTIFTLGCNFRCPFCHNRELVNTKCFYKSGGLKISEKAVLSFIESRKKLIDGVCITGGEPTIHKDLPIFLEKLRKLGLETKLDTNGTNPAMLSGLIERGLIHFIAMDIKSSFCEYSKAVGISVDLDKIKSSIRIILGSGLDYEFRTTVVPGIHDSKSLVNAAGDLESMMKEGRKEADRVNWVLQRFRPKNCLDPKYEGVKPYSINQMKKFLSDVRALLPSTEFRDGSVY